MLKYLIQTSIFRYSKKYGSLTHETRIKDAVNMGDLICLLATVRTLKLCKMSYLSHMKIQKDFFMSRMIWINNFVFTLCLIIATNLCTFSLIFMLSNAFTFRVRAFDASKSQYACIVLSQFSRKSKYAVINL